MDEIVNLDSGPGENSSDNLDKNQIGDLRIFVSTIGKGKLLANKLEMDFKFDRSKVFYPYVVNYIVSLHGKVELMSRDFYSRIQNVIAKGQSLDEFRQFLTEGDEKNEKFFKEVLASNIKPTALIRELSLKSEQRQDQIEISISEIAKDFVDNHIYLLPFQIKASGALLIMAYETAPDIKYDNTDPIWNFLYHCRNAIAHNGEFNINSSGKKRLPAKWGNLEILESMHGLNLFKDGTDNPGFLSPGDPLYLLYDIEQKYL